MSGAVSGSTTSIPSVGLLIVMAGAEDPKIFSNSGCSGVTGVTDGVNFPVSEMQKYLDYLKGTTT
jgi:hypothetical protein